LCTFSPALSAYLRSSWQALRRSPCWKNAGALYLIWLGLKTWREARVVEPTEVQTTGVCRAFREGVVVEALNPKTAAFFLAFIPQFVDPSANVATQFIVLGFISVTLNTSVDLIVTYWAAKARAGLIKRRSFITKARQASGAVMCGLGATCGITSVSESGAFVI
jgi:threonine/homoserine/homoserine lactone efflux protein